MKAGVAAAAFAAMATGAHASYPHHRRAHELFARAPYETCVAGCTTIYSTITGAGTLVPNPPPATTSTPATSSTPVAAITSSTSSTPKPVYSKISSSPASSSPTEAETTTSVEVIVVVPTPEVHSCSTTGTYTFPATTVTVTESTTVCAAETTKVPAGTYTLGGVTTIVETATTVTCPYAKETEVNGVVTSVIDTTVYVCPSAGTYTIAPVTKSCSEETILVYPVPTSYAPGTYTAPAQTVTVTETGYVYVCPYSSSGLVTTSTSAPKATYKAPKTNPTTSSVVEEAETTTSASKSKSTSSSYQNTGTLQGSGDHYGITYTPYQSSNGDCKSASAVRSDIQTLKNKGFSIIRVYSTDCDTLSTVGAAAKEFGLELILGVFVKETGCTYQTSDIKTQVDAIAAWAEWDIVKLIVVGNEAIMNGYCSASQLKELISVVKSKCSSYTGPYTISETLNIWQQDSVSSVICPVVDVTGANIHPYFNSAVEPSGAGEFVSGQLDLLKDICSGNDVINLECGWPTRGDCNGVACPGKTQQAAAIKSIRESCGDKTVFFSYEDDMWKQPGDCGCEQSWGSKSCF